MNFFLSEENIRNWAQFNPDSADASLPLNDEVTVFSTEAAKHRLSGDFISQWAPKQLGERAEAAQRLGKTGPFWGAGQVLTPRRIHLARILKAPGASQGSVRMCGNESNLC